MNVAKTLSLLTLSLVSVFSARGAGDVLMVVQNPVSPGANDAAMKGRLVSFGFNVVLKGDSASATADANGKVLVLVSSSVGSGNVNKKFRDVAVPVLNTERAIQDDMLMTLNETDSPPGHGQAAANQTDIIITDSTHPLAGGLPDGQVTVVTAPNSTFNWGEPATSAQVVARLADGSDHPCIYGYTNGALLIDGTTRAPARRVFLYQGDSGLAMADANGIALFDAAVAWALNVATLGTPPTVSLTQPANGASFAAGSDISLQAAASDAETSVTRVEFYAGTNRLGESTSGSPFTFTWTNAPAGRHNLTARAFDTSGASGISTPVKVVVGTPPPLIVMVVGNPAGLTTGETALRSRLVSFGYDVALVSDTASSTNDAIGAALIVTSSTVTSANVGAKFQNVAVPVLNWENGLQDDLLMTGQLPNSDYGESFEQTSVLITDASHPLAGGLSVGEHTVTTAPMTFSWGYPQNALGTAAIVATLSDGSGFPCIYGYDSGALLADGVTRAPARRVQIFLQDNTYSVIAPDGSRLVDAALAWALNRSSLGIPPTVTLVQPLSGAKFAAGANVSLLANASDADGSVAKVEFFAGDSLLGQATSGPSYSITWSNAPVGIHHLTAKATDNTGFTAVSDAAVIVVGEPPPHILFVVGNPGAPNISDLGMKARLESSGSVVTMVGDAASAASDAVGHKLVVISASVTSGNVGDKFQNSTLPVINMEHGLEDNFLMTLDSTSDHGEVYGQTSINITNAAHPLAAGLDVGNHIVATTPDRNFTWGLPAPNATIVATTSEGYPCIFAYDKGELLIDGTTLAPERRINFFLGDNAFTVMNATGVALFDAAVNWALPQAPRFNPPVVQSGMITVSWAGSGKLETAGTPTGVWSEIVGATSPFSTNTTAAARFFRLRQ